MNDTTQANATAKTAFGCRNGLATEVAWEPLISALFSGVAVSGSRVTSRCALASASMAGSAAASAARSSGLIRSRITASRSARTARRRASVSRPWSVSRTWTTRPSAGSASRRTSPASCRRATSCVMAGCVTPSWTASAVSRRGPDRSSVASVAAAVRDSPSAGLSDRTSPISRSTPAAIPAASARSDPWAISISNLYQILMYFCLARAASRQDFTVAWVHPVASAPLAVVVMTFVPGRSGTVARKCPSGPATALTTAVVSPDPVASPAEITTVLPAGAVPLTTIWPPAAPPPP